MVPVRFKLLRAARRLLTFRNGRSGLLRKPCHSSCSGCRNKEGEREEKREGERDRRERRGARKRERGERERRERTGGRERERGGGRGRERKAIGKWNLDRCLLYG